LGWVVIVTFQDALPKPLPAALPEPSLPETSRKAVRRTGLLADITRQKETEELLASRAKHLEALVVERTARLQEAVAELEHFSYTLAHDLRAPLRAIRGYDELLLSEGAALSPEHKQFLERSSLAAARMDGLIVGKSIAEGRDFIRLQPGTRRGSSPEFRDNGLRRQTLLAQTTSRNVLQQEGRVAELGRPRPA